MYNEAMLIKDSCVGCFVEFVSTISWFVKNQRVQCEDEKSIKKKWRNMILVTFGTLFNYYLSYYQIGNFNLIYINFLNMVCINNLGTYN